jgi:hypothetical protein
MIVWVYVEGESDKIALNALWTRWREQLRQKGWGIQVVPLDDKSRYFRKIGPRVAEKLVNNNNDLVVGLPDLYPNAEYAHTEFKHADLTELKAVQMRLVSEALQKNFSAGAVNATAMLARFHSSAFKHDLEVLLLAATNELRLVLGTTEKLGNWRHPAEEQNHQKSPKYVVNELFRTKKGQSYKDTVHARAVLGKVSDIRKLLYRETGQLECPVFKEAMDWIASKTGVAGY